MARQDAPWRDEELLREKYLDEEQSTYDIADELGCASGTVRRWLENFNIERRSDGRDRKSGLFEHKEWLRREYIEKDRTTKDIAKDFDVHRETIRRWVMRHGLELKGPSETKTNGAVSKLFDEEWLEGQYWDESKSMPEIADDLGLAETTVLRWMDKHGIERRTLSEALRGENCHLWNPDKVSEYGPNWREQRRKVRERDDYECQLCGLRESEMENELDVHHIVPRKEFMSADKFDYEKANKLKNLITLCRSCHMRWETMPLNLDTRR